VAVWGCLGVAVLWWLVGLVPCALAYFGVRLGLSLWVHGGSRVQGLQGLQSVRLELIGVLGRGSAVREFKEFSLVVEFGGSRSSRGSFCALGCLYRANLVFVLKGVSMGSRHLVLAVVAKPRQANLDERVGCKVLFVGL